MQLLEADANKPLPCKLTFRQPDKIRELARRGEALGSQAQKLELEAAIENGRGAVYLRLTPAQYARLRRS